MSEYSEESPSPVKTRKPTIKAKPAVRGISKPSGAKLHLCPTCNQPFVYKRQLEAHLKRLTGCYEPETIVDKVFMKQFTSFETAITKYYDALEEGQSLHQRHLRCKDMMRKRDIVEGLLKNHGEQYDEKKITILKKNVIELANELNDIIDVLYEDKKKAFK